MLECDATKLKMKMLPSPQKCLEVCAIKITNYWLFADLSPLSAFYAREHMTSQESRYFAIPIGLKLNWLFSGDKRQVTQACTTEERCTHRNNSRFQPLICFLIWISASCFGGSLLLETINYISILSIQYSFFLVWRQVTKTILAVNNKPDTLQERLVNWKLYLPPRSSLWRVWPSWMRSRRKLR